MFCGGKMICDRCGCEGPSGSTDPEGLRLVAVQAKNLGWAIWIDDEGWLHSCPPCAAPVRHVCVRPTLNPHAHVPVG